MRENLAGRCMKLPVACDFNQFLQNVMIYCMDREHNEYIYIYIYTEFATHGNFENSVQERYRKKTIATLESLFIQRTL